MSEYLIYLLEVSGCFTFMYLTFHFFFRKLTFHKLNRLILLLTLALPFIIPFLPIIKSHNLLPEQVLAFVNFEYTSLLSDSAFIANPLLESSYIFSWLHLLFVAYWIGFSFALYRFCHSLSNLFYLKNKSIKYAIGQFQFFITDTKSVFSFANWIFIPKDKTEQAAPIIEHEKAHAYYKHTVDLILIELFVMICWFNPFVYIFRKSLRTIHEFQADEAVIKKQVKKSLYLKLLLNELGAINNSKLYSYFNYPIIQNRVDMITKPNSNRKNMLRYLILIPVTVVLLCAFRSEDILIINQNNNIELAEIKAPDFVFPIPNRSINDIVSLFGVEGKNAVTKLIRLHGGIDIKAPEGDLIIASSDGIVSTATYKPDWGNLIIISHSDGYQTWYAHLKDLKVSENQVVEKGTIIGSVGHTGQAKNTHLHFEVRHNGKRLNPIDLLIR